MMNLSLMSKSYLLIKFHLIYPILSNSFIENCVIFGGGGVSDVSYGSVS